MELIKAGDMVEITVTTRGIDDFNRSYLVSPGDNGIIIETPASDMLDGDVGLLIGSEIIYISTNAMQKVSWSNEFNW